MKNDDKILLKNTYAYLKVIVKPQKTQASKNVYEE